MATTVDMTELPMRLRLSEQASANLSRRAIESGRDVAAVASDLLEQAVTRPTVDEILAPFRRQVADSGMNDDELDDFFRGKLDALRHERKAKPA